MIANQRNNLSSRRAVLNCLSRRYTWRFCSPIVANLIATIFSEENQGNSEKLSKLNLKISLNQFTLRAVISKLSKQPYQSGQQQSLSLIVVRNAWIQEHVATFRGANKGLITSTVINCNDYGHLMLRIQRCCASGDTAVQFAWKMQGGTLGFFFATRAKTGANFLRYRQQSYEE